MAPVESYRHVLRVKQAEEDRIDAVKRLLASQGWWLIPPTLPLIGIQRSPSAASRFISSAKPGASYEQ